MYAKAHPFNYIPVKNKKSIRHDSMMFRGESLDHIQVVRMKNGQTRTIKHYVGHLTGGSRI